MCTVLLPPTTLATLAPDGENTTATTLASVPLLTSAAAD
jgi:hypothetical protein